MLASLARRTSLFVLLLAGAGCAPTLRLTRTALPEASLGDLRTLSVDVSTNVKKAVESSVINGLVSGELPVPARFEPAVRDSLAQALEGLGFAVCPAAPCGDGAMTAVLTEAGVNSEIASGVANARLTAWVRVTRGDGRKIYDFTFWSRRSGSPRQASELAKECAEGVAGRMRATLLPRRVTAELPLEDGGALDRGVELLQAGDWNGAVGYFTDLTTREPGLAGAWYDLGVAWEASGDWGRALGAYEQAVVRKRKDSYVEAMEIARLQITQAPLPTAPPPQP